MRLRMWAFIVFVIGMFLLFVMVFLPAKEVFGQEGLKELELNSRVETSGIVETERVLYEGTKLIVVNGVDVVVESNENFKGKQVIVKGRVSDYEGEMQLVAEEVLF